MTRTYSRTYRASFMVVEMRKHGHQSETKTNRSHSRRPHSQKRTLNPRIPSDHETIAESFTSRSPAVLQSQSSWSEEFLMQR